MKPVPVIVTPSPPLMSDFVFGNFFSFVTVGAATYVKWSPAFTGLVPFGVVTRTSTVPAAPAGVVASTVVASTGVNDVAATPPMLTALAPVRLVPVMTMFVPPAVEPLFGTTLVTVGPGGGAT